MYNVLISKNQHYSCMMCGKCCRRFNVRITQEEIERIQKLDWGDTPHPTDFYEKIKDAFYFKRKPDGGCVFLDDKGVCSIHAKFGFDVKALTCRGYPMNIISVAPGELSVLARMDCPAVLSNYGKTLKESSADIQQLIAEMKFGDGFNGYQRDYLERPALNFLCTELHRIIRDKQLPLPQRMLWLDLIQRKCQQLGAPFINDLDTFKTCWLTILKKLFNSVRTAHQPLTAYQRLMFRAWLALYARRDEELVSRSMSVRLRNFRHNFGFMAGSASWHTMGNEHPDISSKQAKLLTVPLDSIGDDETWKPYLEFLINRIDTFQFFGAAFYNLSFYKSLHALILTFPLTLAVATMHAAADNRRSLTQDDVFKAVLAIDHCHGRSPALNTLMARYYEMTFSDQRLVNLIYSMAPSP